MWAPLIHTEVADWDVAMWDYLQEWGTAPIDVGERLAAILADLRDGGGIAQREPADYRIGRRPVLLFETGLPIRYYIPQEDIRMDLLSASRAVTHCPYKGAASYWSIKIGDEVRRNVVWGYLDPIEEIPKIKGLLSFFNEKLDIYVDGALETRPETFWS